MTKILFMGTPAFSVPILEGLVESGYEVLGVVTQPDRKVGRKGVLTPPPVKERALALGLKVFQPEKIADSNELQELMSMEIDLIVTAAFGQFLPEKLLKHPVFGAINVHASLLPKYRGGAPVHYAIMNAEKETGITIMKMVKRMDAGAILATQSLAILEEDTVGSLFEKLSAVGRHLLLNMLPDFLAGKIEAMPQNEEEATFSPNITPEQEEIDWTKSAREIFNKVRGLYPFPVAHTYLEGNRVKLHHVMLTDEISTLEAGTITARGKKELKVVCGDTSVLSITLLQPPGKKALTISEYLNGVGRNLEVGMKFGRQ